MEEKCPRCGSEELMKGKLESAYGVAFIPEGQKGIVKKSSYVTALACKKCGAVFGLELADDPIKLTDK